jgi:AraC-like DNA-binding protein
MLRLREESVVVLVLDTNDLPERGRRDAIVETMRAAGIAAQITHQDAECGIEVRMSVWSLGGGVQVLRRAGSGIRLTQAPRRTGATTPERVSLSVMTPGRWRFTQGDFQATGASGHRLVLTDHTSAYEFARMDTGVTRAVNMDLEALGLPVDVVRAAVGHLDTSPLYGLVRQHILHVARDLDQLEGGPASTMLGGATAELARALISSAGGQARSARDALDGSLQHRIALYVQAELGDPGLTPGQIAHVHHISVRQLYSVWSGVELSLAEWIMNERLELSRRELAKPGDGARTIAAIARGCGFVDAAHFARRFRAAYGMSPREWRQSRQPLAASAQPASVSAPSFASL